MIMSEEKVSCPVCNRQFSPSEINIHVNSCLNSGQDSSSRDDNDPMTGRKRKLNATKTNKSGWGFLMSVDKSDTNVSSKKIKLSPATKARRKEDDVVIIDDVDDSERKLMKSTENEFKKSKSKSVFSVSGDNLKDESEDISDKKHSILDMSIPLAEQMRPVCFENYIGQDNAIGKDKMLWSLLQGDNTPSMILWGPPGCGKTTLAKIVAKRCKGKSKFVQKSATSSGVNDVKELIKTAKNDLKMFKKRTILFLDEIHRFNKLQQDSLLPHVEDGTITLIGATTENPSFQVNTALLSRCRVVVLDKLDNEAILKILMKAVETLNIKVVGAGKDDDNDVKADDEDDDDDGDNGDDDDDVSKEENSNGDGVVIEKAALEFLSAICDGDARAALNGLQMTVQSQMAKSSQSESVLQTDSKSKNNNNQENKTSCVKITVDNVKEGLQRSHIAYDKTGEEHYNTISALHKSMRGSDDSAALYWLARMMEGGEEPLYIARRLIEFASEDVGIADPHALMLAVSTYQACHFIGRPECQKPLAECVVYLSRAPKSIEAVSAYMKAKECIHNHQGPLPGVPLHLRNASTKLMKNLGYGKGYKYNPGSKGPVKQEYFPECLVGTNFFK